MDLRRIKGQIEFVVTYEMPAEGEEQAAQQSFPEVLERSEESGSIGAAGSQPQPPEQD